MAFVSLMRLPNGDSGGTPVRGRFTDIDPLAVVDIGSNTVRLVIYEGLLRAPTTLFNDKEHCGLGKLVSSTGRLDPESVSKAIRTLRRFRAVCKTLHVKRISVFATAAVRLAQNGQEFLKVAQEAIGATIEVLNGEREAELASKGIKMGFREPDGITGDLGGGSLELIELRDGIIRNAATLSLGGLSLMDASSNQPAKAAQIVRAELGKVRWLPNALPKRFYAVGGSWRALATLHMAQTNYPLRVIHGYTLDAPTAISFCRSIRRANPVDQIARTDVLSKQRRETLQYAATTLEQSLKATGADKLVFSAFGIREGLLYEQLPEATRAEDPLISFCRDYALLRSRSTQLPAELFEWTAPLFADGKFAETPEDTRLRRAACFLSDIGWRAHPDYRGAQSFHVIAHAALSGIDHPGRMFLALTVYTRHEGPGEVKRDAIAPELLSLVPKPMVDRAKALGAALRAAYVLCSGMHGVIGRTPVRKHENRLLLSIPADLEALVSDRVERRFRALAKSLDLEFHLDLTHA